jgi:hypothetical protein
LIQGTTEGAKTCYCLDPGRIRELKKMAEKFINDMNITAIFDCE